jgi:S1-C subfamily serine protease
MAATSPTVQSLPSVVRIDTGKTIGSGFFVTDALVATNAHVLAGASSARLSSGQGAGVFATLIYVDRDLDFAVLQSPVKAKPLPVREGPITEGEGVTAIGFPQGRDVVAASTGTVHAVNEVVIVHDALIAAGSSGGPLVGSDGRVLGVNTILTKARGDRANATDRTIAVKITTILKKLESR